MVQNQLENEVGHVKEQKGQHTRIFGILTIVLFVVFSVAVGYFIGRPMLQFVSEPEKFRLWVDGHGIWSRFAFIGMMLLQIIIALIPGEPLEIGAGYAFGFWEGTLLCMVSILLGSALLFWITRCYGTKVVQIFFPTKKIQSLKFLKNSNRLNTLTFFLFFIPGTPKDLLTYVAGLTPIRFSTYMIIANLARIPSVISSTVGGNALGKKQYLFAVLTFIILAGISLTGLFIYKQITRRKAGAHKQEELLAADIETDEPEGEDLG